MRGFKRERLFGDSLYYFTFYVKPIFSSQECILFSRWFNLGLKVTGWITAKETGRQEYVISICSGHLTPG